MKIKKVCWETIYDGINKIINDNFPPSVIIEIPLPKASKRNHLLGLHFDSLKVSGVYLIYSHDELLYIGLSGNIGQRIINHISTKRMEKASHIRLIRIDDKGRNAPSVALERYLIDKLNPKYNMNDGYFGFVYPKEIDRKEVIEILK